MARPRPHVHILMCTRNGARFLPDQLDSFLVQTHADWSLWVSDDGSTDATRDILYAFRRANPARPVHILAGPERGAAANFLSLLAQAVPAGGFVALSDQDDVWLPDRLDRGLEMLERRPWAGPAIYGGATIEARADLSPLPPARRPPRSPSFANALVQNTLPGNTILMNPSAHAIARSAAQRAPDVPHHDWWLYMLMSGVGADIVIDDQPTVLYRQHGQNALGAHRGIRATLGRLAILATARYGAWMRANAEALAASGLPLTSENEVILREFRAALDKPKFRRAAWFRRLGIRRQTGFGTLCIYAATAVGWI